MNRIRETLEAGKAIHCRTEDEARRLFEVMGWRERQNYTLPWNYEYPHLFWAEEYGWNGNIKDCSGGREIVPFSTLTSSRLAEILGVDDGQDIEFKGKRYTVFKSGIMEHNGTSRITLQSVQVLVEMINHPEEIQPCPVWSEETIKAARAAELLGFVWAYRDTEELCLSVDEPYRDGRDMYCDGKICELASNLFPEVSPGQTVKLSEIK